MASSKDFDDDWNENWAEGFIPWHINYVQPCLEQHYQKLLPQNTGHGQPSTARFLLPLCGKSLDLIWLSDKGFQVVGIEGVEQVILDFFKENNIAYDVKNVDTEGTKCYSSLDKTKDICIYQVDVFQATPAMLGGSFDAIWDRGSLSAIGLYMEDRGHRYADILLSLLRPHGCIMIENHIWFEDPGPLGGPPSHVPDSALKDLFGKNFDIMPLEVDQSCLAKWHQYHLVYNLMTMKKTQ